ncbi:hypothetical protein G9P44_002588 [Scheffersomyces stipitis]|nr:hypothetical protein G9P44_002588 [Scheffersomyces stipitis]
MASSYQVQFGIEAPYKLKYPNRRIVEEIVHHDGVNFFTVYFPVLESVPIRGRLILLHGWSEHSGMYYRLMESLTSLGYSCFIYDQRGSGRTSLGAERGIVGATKEVTLTDLDRMIEHFQSVTKESGTDQETLPLGIVGHSMGGGIALSYLSEGKYRNIISSCLVNSPLVKPHKCLAPCIVILYIGYLGAYLFPNWKYSQNETTQDSNDVEDVTTSEEWKQYLNTELMCRDGGTLRQLVQMLDRGLSLLKSDYSIGKTTRVMILQPKNDRITNSEATEQLYNNIDVDDKVLVHLPGRHALFIETDDNYAEVCACLEKFYS